MKDRSVLLGSLAAGFLASACCIGPLVLGAVGLGSVGLAASLAPLRPWFLGLTAVFLALGFYLAYRRLPAGACAPGEPCAPPVHRRLQRTTLWVVAVLSVGFATYPSWGVKAGGGATAVTGARDAAAGVVTLDVRGMTCDGCAAEIERSLRQVPGVARARVEYARSRAEVAMAQGQADPAALIAAVEKAGYHARVAAAEPPRRQKTAGSAVPDSLGSRPASPQDPRSGPHGQWRGRLTVGPDETAELVLDLGRVAGRWTGQFDLHDFGVEDYPVEVTLAGRKVTLHLTAAEIDFGGMLSPEGDALAGIARSGEHADSLRLTRVGEARLSEDFIRLETLAEDPTRVESLSLDATELRRRFNQHRAHARLVMLLSPT